MVAKHLHRYTNKLQQIEGLSLNSPDSYGHSQTHASLVAGRFVLLRGQYTLFADFRSGCSDFCFRNNDRHSRRT